MKTGKQVGYFPLRVAMAAGMLLACFAVPPQAAWCSKKSSRTLTTANGGAIRKVYIAAASPDMTSTAASQLSQQTCLTVVSNPKLADAVLQVGIALPGLGGGGGAPAPDIFGPSDKPQTQGDNKSKPQRSVSATCSDSSGSGGCTHSYKGFAGGVAEQPSADWPGNVGTRLDVSLTQPGNSSNELWEPNPRKKKPWSTQLRRAAGCPVCLGEHFNPHKYPTYRVWIQAECPSVLGKP